MTDKDKLFLIVYFGVKSMDVFKGNQIMIGFYEKLKQTLDDTIKLYVVPQRTTNEIKFEILNTENVSDDKITSLEKIYKEFLNEFKKSI
jgi:hypothetical protein